jgi:hypothetical protein
VWVSNNNKQKRKEKEICSKANEDANEANQMQTICKARSKEFHARQFVKSIEALYTCSNLERSQRISTQSLVSLLFISNCLSCFMLFPNNTNIDLTTTINESLL